MPRTNTGQLSEYRSAMNRKGEIAIGVRARAERRKRYWIGAAGLALMGAAVATHFLLRLPERIPGGRTSAIVLVQCMDAQCGFGGTVELPVGEVRFPVQCPRCKQQSCQKVWECRYEDCKHRFVPQGTEAEVVCPECGRRRVGTATNTGGEVPRE